MTIQKNDFIEIEFTGKIKDGRIFDSNKKEDLAQLNPKANPRPFIFPVGNQMFLEGIDQFLIGKEIGSYHLELQPEKAFGLRSSELTKILSIKLFSEHKQQPYPGMVFDFNGRLGKILSVSGGRVIVDFNHPLAGKVLEYDFEVKRILDNLEEKSKSFLSFIFGKEPKFKINQDRLILELEKGSDQFAKLFEAKIKEILGLKLEVTASIPSDNQ